MSEELIQRNLIEAPEKMGDWNYYNIGATTLKALKNAKIIPDRDYDEFENKKPDALIVKKPNVIAAIEWYRQVLCANSFTSLAELSLHRAGKPALNYLVAEDRERVKGGEAACEALDVNSVFCYQPASSSCISMYFMLMYFFPPHWVPAT